MLVAGANGVKVHIGCGTVYLYDWVNVDLPSAQTFLAVDRPDLVERWGTTEDRYYARHQDKTVDSLRAGPLAEDMECDRYGSFEELPVQANTAVQVLARHCFEHLSVKEARRALANMYAILKPGGQLRIDVPDHQGTLEEFKRTGDAFYIRHLLGPRRNAHGFHMMSYTQDMLKQVVRSAGFRFVYQERNIHFFPAFCLRFEKT